MPLSTQQVEFFSTFGFLRLPGLMNDRIALIQREFEGVWDKANLESTPGRRACLVPFVDRSDYLSSLLDDPRIRKIPEQLLGEDFNYCTSDGNYYFGDTAYHSNPFPGGLKALKVAFYLDSVGPESGCLRVFPGSHNFDDSYSDRLGQGMTLSALDTWGRPESELPAYPISSEPGDVVVFAHTIRHGAVGGGDGRRLFVMNFAERCPEDKLPALRDHIHSMARFWNDQYYGPAMMRTAGPSRMRHLRQILDNQADLPLHAARARASMSEPSQG